MPLPNWGSTPIPVVLVDETGAPISGSNVLDTTGGGGGGGDASAANQTSQITQETAINTVLGVKTDAKSTATDATSISAMQVLKQISASVQAFAPATAPATGTQSIVASSATDVSILASNASRKGATVYNDSTVVLYLLLSNATSSATVYTVQLSAGAYYEVPFAYTGVLKGIWASATGNARVTEIT